MYHRANEYKYLEMISNKLSYREIVSRSVFANPITNDALTSLLMFNKHLNYISSGNIFYQFLFVFIKHALKGIPQQMVFLLYGHVDQIQIIQLLLMTHPTVK